MPSSSSHTDKQNKKRRSHHRRSTPGRTQSSENTTTGNPTPQVTPENPSPTDPTTEFSDASITTSLAAESNSTTNGSTASLEIAVHSPHSGISLDKARTKSDDDWATNDLSVSQRDIDLSGEPQLKPSGTTISSSLTQMTAQENRKKVAFNIRRKKMIIWMMTLAFFLVWIDYADIFERMFYENDEIFSMTIMKPWMMPGLITEFSLAGLGLFSILLKMGFMHDKCVGYFHRLIMAFNNLQFLLVLLGMPFAVYYFSDELTVDMKSDLKADLAMGDDNLIASPSWNITQIERQCCGYKNRFDWIKHYNNHTSNISHPISDETTVGVEVENGFLANERYPSSCCSIAGFGNATNYTLSEIVCTEASKQAWPQGCHQAEFLVILEYAICTASLIFISLILGVMIRLCIDKLERYMTIFRPREMF